LHVRSLKRCADGTSTFLVKVKACRGEPANDGANILANMAISDLKVGKERCQRTNQSVFTWRTPCRKAGKVTYQDCHLTFDTSVRDTIQRGTAENKVQNHEERLTGVWKQMRTFRRRCEKWW